MIYLDHAATSFPKPLEVWQAMERWFRDLGVDAARGTSRRHEQVALEVDECRQRLGRLCGVPARNVVFCSGATEALNLALKGILAPGARVWTTRLEHNAVVRPLIGLRERLGIEVRFFEPASCRVEPEQIRDALEREPPPDLFVFSHASNVTGAVQDFTPVAGMLRQAGARILADCAQTAGRLDLRALDVDAYAIPGHKGLHGPPGIGALCLAEALPVVALKEGGTGSSLATDRMPRELPQALEAGTPNTPGILGWLAGIRWTEARGIPRIHEHECNLVEGLRQALAPLEEAGKLRRIGAASREGFVAVLSLTFDELDPAEVALALEQNEIHVRAGFHCAPYVHAYIGSEEGGTARLSLGACNTAEEVARAAEVIADIA